MAPTLHPRKLPRLTFRWRALEDRQYYPWGWYTYTYLSNTHTPTEEVLDALDVTVIGLRSAFLTVGEFMPYRYEMKWVYEESEYMSPSLPPAPRRMGVFSFQVQTPPGEFAAYTLTVPRIKASLLHAPPDDDMIDTSNPTVQAFTQYCVNNLCDEYGRALVAFIGARIAGEVYSG